VAAYRLYVEELELERKAFFKRKNDLLASRPKPLQKSNWVDLHKDDLIKLATVVITPAQEKMVPADKATPKPFPAKPVFNGRTKDFRTRAEKDAYDSHLEEVKYWEQRYRAVVGSAPSGPPKLVAVKVPAVTEVDQNKFKQLVDDRWTKVVSRREKKKASALKKKVASAAASSVHTGIAEVGKRLAEKSAKSKGKLPENTAAEAANRKKGLKKLKLLSKSGPSDALVNRIRPVAAQMQLKPQFSSAYDPEQIESSVVNDPGFRDFAKKYRESIEKALPFQPRAADRIVQNKLNEVVRERTTKAILQCWQVRGA